MDAQKYQQISKAFKQIIQAITTLELGQLKLFFVNLEKKVINKQSAFYSQYLTLKDLLDNTKQAKGKVPLHFAVARGDLGVINYMIKGLNLDPLVKDKDGNNPFFTAIQHGHLDVVKFFIQQLNFSVNMTKQGQIAPVHIAANNNHIQTLEYLFSKGAQIQKVSIYGKPINWAAGNVNLEAIKFLVQHGANPNGDLTCPAPAPLILSIDFASKQMYKLLIEKGADVNVRDPHGFSTLHVAAQKGDLQTVKDLVNRGVSVDYQVQGKSALYLAFQNHKFNVVAYLKQKTKKFQQIQAKIKQERQKQQKQKQNQNKPKAQEIKNIGNVLFGQKKYNQALAQYLNALDFDRNNAVIHRNLAACYLALNKFEKALHECQTAKILQPKNVKTIYREAQAYIGLGNLVQASSSLWECAMIQPSSQLFRKEFQKYLDLAKKAHNEQNQAK